MEKTLIKPINQPWFKKVLLTYYSIYVKATKIAVKNFMLLYNDNNNPLEKR